METMSELKLNPNSIKEIEKAKEEIKKEKFYTEKEAIKILNIE